MYNFIFHSSFADKRRVTPLPPPFLSRLLSPSLRFTYIVLLSISCIQSEIPYHIPSILCSCDKHVSSRFVSSRLWRITKSAPIINQSFHWGGREWTAFDIFSNSSRRLSLIARQPAQMFDSNPRPNSTEHLPSLASHLVTYRAHARILRLSSSPVNLLLMMRVKSNSSTLKRNKKATK